MRIRHAATTAPSFRWTAATVLLGLVCACLSRPGWAQAGPGTGAGPDAGADAGAGPGIDASAGVQADAFSAEVAVADRGPAEQGAAYAAALRQVLLANSGDKTLMNRDDVRAALRDAGSYVETFRFRAPEPGSAIAADTPVTETVRRSGEAAGLLLVRFDRERTLALVAGDAGDAGVRGRDPVGGIAATVTAADAARAFADVDSVLVWLLIEDGERTIAGSDPAAAKVRERVREIAGGAGTTVVFGEAGDLAPGALRAPDAEAIRTASLRYATDAVLVGRLARGGAADIAPPALPDAGSVPGAVPGTLPGDASGTAPGTASGIDLRGRAGGTGDMASRADRGGRPSPATGWRGDWLKLGGVFAPAAVEGDDVDAEDAAADEARPSFVALATATSSPRLDDALREGLGWLLPDTLGGAGAGYAYGGPGDAAEGLVWVGSIDSIAEYARVMALFESVASVESVYPRAIGDGTGVFAVRPRRALQEIAGAANASGWLRPGAPPVADAGTGLDVGLDAGIDAGMGSARREPSARRRVEAAARRSGSASDELARQADLAYDALL